MSNDNTKTIALRARIDDKNGLVVEYTDEFGVAVPVESIENLSLTDVDEVVVTIADFFQNESVYQVYGVVLGPDGGSIAAYWGPAESGTGISHTFAIPRPGQGKAVRFAIGALPRTPGAAIPRPVPRSEGGGLPIAPDDKVKSTN